MKISAFIFLAIEIASLAGGDGQQKGGKRECEKRKRKPTILSPILIAPTLMHVDDERRIDDPRPKGLEEVEDEETGRDGGVFERSDRSCALSALLSGRVGPFEYLLVGDGATGPGEGHERFGDVQPIKSSRGVGFQGE